ncbi:MAG: hypothetical protein B1H03_02110 [Planctomycetales bacterium 4484_113]|nr:MAG: hypothetical protein B1H03_02110 [Planctomycetales bacterium 4484_113]
MSLAEKAYAAFLNAGKTLATAESCTGGLLSSALTKLPGVSDIYLGGVVAYSNLAKERLLGVSPDTIKEKGAVSEEVAAQLATGVREKLSADVGVGITGIAGPSGGTDEKPVGLVYAGFTDGKQHIVREYRFEGTREEIRQATVDAVLTELAQLAKG